MRHAHCTYPQIKGLGFYVVYNVYHRFFKNTINKYFAYHIKLNQNQKAIIDIELNRKEYQLLHPY